MTPTPKIINLSLPKTGTTSLEKAIRLLGYSVSDLAVELPPSFPGYDVILKKIAHKNHMVSDMPSCSPKIYKQYFQLYPNTKAILLQRPVEDWLKSSIRHFGGTESSPRELVFGKGKSDPAKNKKHWMKFYAAHKTECFSFLRNNSIDHLILDIDGTNKSSLLCEFLDKDLSLLRSFPHVNKKATYGS